MNEDSAAGTTGDKNIYQNFFICLSYEKKELNGNLTFGLYIQYGIQIDSDETSHSYLNYFDPEPLDPMYYSFGSRNADVQILNAHLENFNEDEQIRLRCKLSSTLNKATLTSCDYKCHSACNGCYAPYSVMSCKKCLNGKLIINSTLNGYNQTEKHFAGVHIHCSHYVNLDPSENLSTSSSRHTPWLERDIFFFEENPPIHKIQPHFAPAYILTKATFCRFYNIF